MQQGWTNKYVGIPYRDKGRDTSGIDCYGLARLVYKEELGIDLPSFDDEYLAHDQNSQSELTARYKEQWIPVEEPKEADLVVFKIAGFESHIGIVVNDKQFLHARSGQDSAIETFDSFKWKNRVAGFFQYTEKASAKAMVTAIPHPLRTERITTAVPAGTTVEQLAEWITKEYGIPPEIKSKITILVNTKVVPRAEWATTVISDSDIVDYRAVPGEDALRIVAFVAIAWYAPMLAGSLTGYTSAAAAAGMLGGSVTLGLTALNAIVTYGLVYAGGMLVNAIAPVTQPKTYDPGQSEKAYMVVGGSNGMVPYESIPFVLGKVRFTPPLGSRAYLSYGSETNSRLSYFNMLLCWGYGPVEIYEDTIKLGEVPISNYDIPAIKHLEGKSTETANDIAALESIYNYDTNQVYSGLELACEGNPEDENITPGPWTEIATLEKVQSLEIALHFPQGCRRIQKSGDGAGRTTGWPIKFRAQVQLQGSTKWEDVGLLVVGNSRTTTWKVVKQGINTNIGLPYFSYVKEVTGEDVYYKDAFTHHMTFTTAEGTLPSNTGLTVRIRRETGDDKETDAYQYLNTSILNTVTFRQYTESYSEPVGTKLAFTAMRIQSTDQLTNRIEGINAIVESRCLDWNGASWVEAPTNNPASLFRYVLESVANPRRVTNASEKIDLAKLQYWHEYCEAKGFTYNSIVASAKGVLDLLREICAAGRASPAMKDGKWTVTIDEPQNIVVQHFSPHNSWGFEGLKALPRIPDAFKIRFFDEDQNYQEVETIVYNYDKDYSNATLFESISLPGVTKQSQVIDHAKWHFAQLKLRPERYTLNSDFEYLVCNRGDRVKVSHDVPMWGLGSGRIKRRISSTIFDIDEKLPFEKSKTYTVRIRSTDKTALLANNGTLDRTIKSTFNITGVQRASGTVTVFCGNHPFQVGDYAEITSSASSVNATSAYITAVTETSISYTLAGANISTTAATGSVKMNSGYYSRLCFTQATTEQECNYPDLLLYGELSTESQDLIVISIETTSNKTARLTLIDYGVTPEYNIFTDYLSLSSQTVFESQITLPPVISQDAFGNLKPLITQVYSAKEAAEQLSPGTWQYLIKVAYSNQGDLPYTTESVECQYDFVNSASELSAKSIRVPYDSCAITIPDITEGKEYRVRLRYISSKGIAGQWTEWTTHMASGFTQREAHTLTLEVDRVTRYLNITPYISDGYLPEDFKAYEVRVFKDPDTGDFWDSTYPEIKIVYTTGTASINLRDFVRPRLSLTGIKYRIACRMLDNSNNYASSSALAEVVLTNLT